MNVVPDRPDRSSDVLSLPSPHSHASEAPSYTASNDSRESALNEALFGSQHISSISLLGNHGFYGSSGSDDDDTNNWDLDKCLAQLLRSDENEDMGMLLKSSESSNGCSIHSNDHVSSGHYLEQVLNADKSDILPPYDDMDLTDMSGDKKLLEGVESAVTEDDDAAKVSTAVNSSSSGSGVPLAPPPGFFSVTTTTTTSSTCSTHPIVSTSTSSNCSE